MLLCTKDDSQGWWEHVCNTWWSLNRVGAMCFRGPWRPGYKQPPHSARTQKHKSMFWYRPFYREAEALLFSSQVDLCAYHWVCAVGSWWWGISCGVQPCKSGFVHPEILRSSLGQICWDEAQQLKVSRWHSKTDTIPLWAPSVAPHSSSLWLPDSWEGQIYSSESSARWLRVYWSQFELAWNQTVEATFFSCGVSPLAVVLMES